MQNFTRNLRGLLAASLLTAVALSVSASDTPPTGPQLGYSTAPLRNPIFDPARVAVETASFNNWLNENYGSLDSDQIAGPREHLYYLIDSHVKHTFASTGQVLPVAPDLVSELLFSWAERLGVYGGSLVFNRVRGPAAAQQKPLNALPKGIQLDLRSDLLHIQSDLGWSVSVPYYFMIGQVGDFRAANGLRTQLAVVSTGAAKDRGEQGHSQATLMLFYSPDADPAAFRAFWEREFEIVKSDDRVSLGVNDLTSQRNVERAGLLHRELVFLDAGRGALGVAYLGNDGTYQWNREHFLDFLRAVQIKSDVR